MPHVKHLRVDTEAEEAVLTEALGLIEEAADFQGADRAAAARRLLERLQAAPVARHGGIVHVEDANYLPSEDGRQRFV